MTEAIGELFRVLLRRLDGRRVLGITAKGSEVVMLFDNGDAVTFGRFLYTPEAGSQDAVQQDLKAYLATRKDFFLQETYEDDDDNDNKRH